MKNADAFKSNFIVDDHELTHLPTRVKNPRQITDGHLAELARAKGGALATFDGGIPGSYLIPE
jgi:predicted nucleic acid-binding protein